jgi:hypothetical protein
MPGFWPDNALVPVLPFLLFQDLSSCLMLSRLGKRDCHHHPFKLFSDAHFLSSSYCQLFICYFVLALALKWINNRASPAII